MQSTRLPGKVLLSMPISGKKPMIRHITDQLEKSSFSAKRMVATSTNSADDEIADYCKSNQIDCFRGDEKDVLSRFIALTEMHNFTEVVRLTGDNPIQDISIIEKTVQNHIKNRADLTTTKGLPLGMNVEVVSGEALLRLKKSSLNQDDKEHVTHHIKHSDDFQKNIVEYDFRPEYETLRLTVDYPSDFVMLSSILELGDSSGLNGLNLVDYVLDNYPWIFEVNKGNIQKKQFNTVLDEVEGAVKLLEDAEMKRAADILRRYEA